MKTFISFAALLGACADSLGAQSPAPNPEIRPFVGLAIPIGLQAAFLNAAPLLGLQAGVEVTPTLTLLGSLGRVQGRDKYLADVGLGVLEYNGGVEFSSTKPYGAGWRFKPFLGLGGGARRYTYHAGSLRDRTSPTGYGSLGTEFQVRAIAFRFEARNAVYRSALAEGASGTGNDLELSLGVAYHLR